MRITLMHNPGAGHGKHRKKDLMEALAKAGHHAIYQSTKKRSYKKHSKNLAISYWLPEAMARSQKSPAV